MGAIKHVLGERKRKKIAEHDANRLEQGMHDESDAMDSMDTMENMDEIAGRKVTEKK